MLDPAALWLPERARLLPEGSVERAYASLGLRQLWHLVYDPCPDLPPDAFDDLVPFLPRLALVVLPALPWAVAFGRAGSFTVASERLLAKAAFWASAFWYSR